MVSLPTSLRRGGRNVLLAATVVGGTAGGVFGAGGVAHAATSDSYAAVASCTEVDAAVVYSPGLRTTKAKAREATLNGVISGCNVFQDSFTDAGTFSATLAGKSSFKAENWGGTFTITWPASSGLLPSLGSVAVTDTGGTESFSGTVTSGAFTQSVFGLALIPLSYSGTGTRKSPVTSELFTNTQALSVSDNT